MKRLSILEAKAGNVVARPVVAGSGVVLVRPGTPLTGELLGRLQSLGIDTLCVEGASPDAKPLDEILQALEQRFAGHEQNALMMELKAVVAARLTRGAAEDCAG